MFHLARRCNPSPRFLFFSIIVIIVLYTITSITQVSIEDGNFAVWLREHPNFNPLSGNGGQKDGGQKDGGQKDGGDKPAPPPELVYKFNSKKDIIISSRRSPSGVQNRIDSLGLDKQVFNPAILELPAGSKHQFMIIARMGHVPVTVGDKKYSKAREVAFFANLEEDDKGEVLLRRSGDWNRTILEGQDPTHHCESEDNIDKYIGPEDAKLYWTRSGAPMLIFTQQVNYEGECQGMFLIDARAAVPELIDAFGKHAALLPPVEVTKPRQLRRPVTSLKETSWNYRFEREKNWGPFQQPLLAGLNETSADELLFHVQPVSPRIYRFVRGQKYVASVPEPATPQTCLVDVVDKGFHQGTPLLSLTLCNRGECAPNTTNTILLGLVQKRRKSPYLWYDSRIVTWNATAPFAFRSVSKRVIYKGTKEKDYNWNCGMIYRWNSTGIPEDRSHGYLDDEIWLTYGVTDREAGWVDVKPEDLLKEHTMCNQYDGM